MSETLHAQPGQATDDAYTAGPWLAELEPEQYAEQLLALHHRDIRYRAYPRIVTVANPVAGTDWSVAVTEGAIWHVLAVTATFATSATVANRGVFLAAGDGTTTPVNSWIGTNISASSTLKLGWIRDGGAVASGAAGAGIGIAFGFPLPGGFVVQTSTSALQAGDQWSSISLFVIEVEERLLNEQVQVMHDVLAGTHADLYPYLMEAL